MKFDSLHSARAIAACVFVALTASSCLPHTDDDAPVGATGTVQRDPAAPALAFTAPLFQADATSGSTCYAVLHPDGARPLNAVLWLRFTLGEDSAPLADGATIPLYATGAASGGTLAAPYGEIEYIEVDADQPAQQGTVFPTSSDAPQVVGAVTVSGEASSVEGVAGQLDVTLTDGDGHARHVVAAFGANEPFPAQ